MARMVKVVYVGKKATAYDNVARSGKMWTGNGDVQEVTDAQAKILIRFEDQWALFNEKDRKAVEKPETIKVQDEDGDWVIVDPDDLTKDLDKMTKSELRALALTKWGKDLPIKGFSTKNLIDQIEEWERDLNVTIGIPEGL